MIAVFAIAACADRSGGSADTEAQGTLAEGVNGSKEQGSSQSVSAPISDSGSESFQGETEDDGVLSYEEYMAMSADEQYEYYMSFETPEAFFEWYNAAKAEYDAKADETKVEYDGTLNIG